MRRTNLRHPRASAMLAGMKPAMATLGAVLIGLALQPMALAQTPPTFSVSITQSSELIEAVSTIRRVSRADIEARNARTLDEALRLLPGIYIRTGGDGTPRLDIRGFRSRHILLLVNGVQVNSTADGQFDPARMSTEGIRDITVSYGSSSVLYGDNALAAVIEVTTMDRAPQAAVDIRGGTPRQAGGGGRYARSAGNWSLAVAAAAFDAGGFRLPASFAPTTQEDGGRRQNSDRQRSDLRASVGYRVSPSLALASEWTHAAGSYGVPGSAINDPADIFAQATRWERVEDYRAVTGQVIAIVTASPRVNLRAWAYRNAQREDRARYDDGTYSSMDDPLVQGTFRSREHTDVTGGSALARIDLSRAGSLRLAVNQRREGFESSGVIRDVSTTGSAGGVVGGSEGGSEGGSGGGGGGGGRGGGSGSLPATFDTRAFSLDQHVDVYTSGAEWQLRPLQQLATVIGAAVNTQRRPGGSSVTEPTWIAGASYDATAALRLRASATRKTRVPSIDQLFNTASGNASLRAERAYGVDAGAAYRLRPTSTLAVSVFSTQARDFIERESGSPFENHDRYRFRGAEITMETSSIPRLGLRGAYSFLDADDVTAEPNPLQTRPAHRLSVDVAWTPVTGSALRGAISHTGSQLFDSRGSVPVQMRVDGYALVDVGFTQTLRRRVDVALDVTNLFDQLYEQSYGLPREGRAAVLTVRARLN